MDVTENLPPGDPQLVQNIVNHLKAKGIFDQFRRDCLADVDTRPAYQNLRQRVDGYVSKFLAQQSWPPELNKNQLRDSLRRQINESGMLAMGVDHLVEQVVNPKVYQVFYPHIENMVKKFLGIESPSDQESDKQLSLQKKDDSQQMQSSSVQDQSKPVQFRAALLPTPFPRALPNPVLPTMKEEKAVEKTDIIKQEPLPSGESESEEAGSSFAETEPPGTKDIKLTPVCLPEPSSSCADSSSKTPLNAPANVSSDTDTSEAQPVLQLPKAEEKDPSSETEHGKEEQSILTEKEIPMQVDPKPPEETEDKVTLPSTLDSDESDSMDSAGGSLTGRLVIDMKGYEREGTPSESNSRDSFKFNKEVKGKDTDSLEISSEQPRFSENSRSGDSFLSKAGSVGKPSPMPVESEENSSTNDSDKGRRADSSAASGSVKMKAAEGIKPKSSKSSSSSGSKDSGSDSSKSRSQIQSKNVSDKSSSKPSSSTSDSKKHNKSHDVKPKASEAKKHVAEDESKYKSKDKGRSSNEKSTRHESKPKAENEALKLKHQKISKSRESLKAVKRKPGSDETDAKSKISRSLKSEEALSSRSRSPLPEAGKSDRSKEKHSGGKLKEAVESSSDESEKDPSKVATDTSNRHDSEKRNSSDSEDEQGSFNKKGSLKTSGDADHLVTGSNSEEQERQQKESQNPGSSDSSKQESSDELKKSEGMGDEQQKTGAVTKKDSHVGHTDKNAANDCVGDVENDDAESISALSDVTVSSVHTSDLSSFDDEISLSSEDELKVALEKPTKKLSLREVKEMAKAYDKIRRKSSEENEAEIHAEKNQEESGALECPKTPDVHSSNSSTTITPVKTVSEDTSSPDVMNETKMSLRRQRKINPRYSSAEFSSIFTKKERIRSSTEGGEADSPANVHVKSLSSKQIRRKRSNQRTDNVESTQENGFHPSEILNSEQNKVDNSVNGVVEDATKSIPSSSDTMNQRFESQTSARKRSRSEEKHLKQLADDGSLSYEEPQEKMQGEEKLQRRTRSRHSNDQRSDNHSSQRYDSSDLYKPRPVISSTSRRSRGVSSVVLEEDGAQKASSANMTKDTVSDDSNSVDSLESSLSRSSRKRGHSFSSDISVASTKRRSKK